METKLKLVLLLAGLCTPFALTAQPASAADFKCGVGTVVEVKNDTATGEKSGIFLCVSKATNNGICARGWSPKVLRNGYQCRPNKPGLCRVNGRAARPTGYFVRGTLRVRAGLKPGPMRDYMAINPFAGYFCDS